MITGRDLSVAFHGKWSESPMLPVGDGGWSINYRCDLMPRVTRTSYTASNLATDPVVERFFIDDIIWFTGHIDKTTFTEGIGRLNRAAPAQNPRKKVA